MAAEDFWRYIGKSEVPLQKPGHLSAVTVAKGIEYGVNLLGCFIEGYVGSGPGLVERQIDFGKMIEAASEFARGSFAWERASLEQLRAIFDDYELGRYPHRPAWRAGDDPNRWRCE